MQPLRGSKSKKVFARLFQKAARSRARSPRRRPQTAKSPCGVSFCRNLAKQVAVFFAPVSANKKRPGKLQSFRGCRSPKSFVKVAGPKGSALGRAPQSAESPNGVSFCRNLAKQVAVFFAPVSAKKKRLGNLQSFRGCTSKKISSTLKTHKTF